MSEPQFEESLRPLLVPLEAVSIDPVNARAHSDENVELLKGSLRRYGQQRPILVDEHDVILAGNGVYLAAKALGWPQIAVVRTSLDGVDRMAYAIADNQLGATSEWDPAILAKQIQALEGAGFPIPELGFVDTALTAILESELPSEPTEPAPVPEPPDEATTQPGDLWILDNHRLLCGDAGSTADVDRLLDGTGGAAMCFTDPPWNVAIGSDGNPRHRQRPGLLNDNLDPREFAEMLRRFARAMQPHLAGDLYCVLGASEWPTLDQCLRAEGYHWSATVIWVKDQFVLGRSKYHRRYEPIWYGWLDKSSFCDRRDLDDVWEIPRPRRSEEHPAMKPVELMVRAIQNSSRRGENVLDPFGGSGSTLIAAEQVGRRACLMELDPRYCDVIVQRWETETGGKAERQPAPAEAPAEAGCKPTPS